MSIETSSEGLEPHPSLPPTLMSALTAVAHLPEGWAGIEERLLLYRLAAGSADGRTVKAAHTQLMSATGLAPADYHAALTGLLADNPTRPALVRIARTDGLAVVFELTPTLIGGES